MGFYLDSASRISPSPRSGGGKEPGDAPSAIPALNEDATLDWLGHSDGVFEPPQIGAGAPDPFFLESDPEAGEGDGVLPLEEGATRYMTSVSLLRQNSPPCAC